MSNANHVFISYSSNDSELVDELVSVFDKEKIPYWKAPEMIPAGSNYAREIPVAIRECQVFLLIVSSSSEKSIWVEKEIDCAVNYRRSIVPFKISIEPMSDMFRFYLNNVQTIQYLDNPDKALNNLLKRLKHLLAITDDEKLSSVQIVKDEALQRQRRANALSANPQPVICKDCGGELKRVSRGTYQCLRCGTMNYDDYQIVRRYIEKNGPSPSIIIARDTGVPRKKIESFLKEDMLEVVKPIKPGDLSKIIRDLDE